MPNKKLVTLVTCTPNYVGGEMRIGPSEPKHEYPRCYVPKAWVPKLDRDVFMEWKILNGVIIHKSHLVEHGSGLLWLKLGW